MFRQPADPGKNTGREAARFCNQLPLPSPTIQRNPVFRLGKAEMPSFSSPLPEIRDSVELAEFLEISEFELRRMTWRNKNYYRIFQREKKSGRGLRSISAPNEALKKVQRKIKSEILDKVETHPACMGYKRGHSIVSNARLHVGKRFVLNLDIRDFFQSVSAARVAGLFVSLGYREEVALMLTRLSCFRNALPQGAPSSPAIANLICHKLDRRLFGFARVKSLSYTRYCDDITISGDSYLSEALLGFVKTILSEEGFDVNPEKTRLFTRRSCQTVTGLTVNEKVNVPRRKRRIIRAVMHRAGQAGKVNGVFKKYAAGLSAFLSMVRSMSCSALPASIGVKLDASAKQCSDDSEAEKRLSG